MVSFDRDLIPAKPPCTEWSCEDGTLRGCGREIACPLGCTDGEPRCTAFSPHNGVPAPWSGDPVGGLTILGHAVIDSCNGELDGRAVGHARFVDVDQSGSLLGVLRLNTLRVAPGAHLQVVGRCALAFSVDHEIAIEGVIDLRGGTNEVFVPGPGGFRGASPFGAAAGCGSGKDGVGLAGGSGGGALDTGGAGGGVGGGSGGTACGAEQLVPLAGGSGGGAGGGGCDARSCGHGGGGGGALALVAGTRVIVREGGSVRVGGGPGGGGGEGKGGGGGGGSGGSVLIEAPAIELAGSTAIAAGGGGGGGVAAGDDAPPLADGEGGRLGGAAAGGQGLAAGGDGGSGAAAAGASGEGATSGGGGGGGSVGRVRINSLSGALPVPALNAVVSQGQIDQS